MNLNDEKVAQFKELFPASSHSISRKPNGLSSLHRSSWYQKLFTHIMKLDIQAVDVAMPGVIEVEPMKILVSAGIALTPAQSAEDSRASFATIRYGWYFRDLVHGEGLVLPAECAEIETRLKTVLSEELSIGFCTYIMREHLALNHIADTSAAVAAAIVQRTPNAKTMPDFCALNTKKELCFVESKGTMVNIRALKSKVGHAKKQLNSVSPSVLMAGPKFVIASFIATQANSSKERSTIRIVDPESAEIGTNLLLHEDQLIRFDYAKVCRFAGRDDLADQLLNRDNWNLPANSTQLTKSPFVPIGFSPGGDCVLLAKDVFHQLSNNKERQLTSSALDYGEAQAEKLYFSNGVAVLKPLVTLG